jgi:uncharacterized protein (AIM24 family)
MFCTHCGTPVPDGSNFCGGCGGQVNRAPAAAPAPAQPSFQPPPQAQPFIPQPPSPPPAAVQPAPIAHTGTAKCNWCGAVIDASLSSCPRCGATIKPSSIAPRAAWGELPGRKDMAKLQFGNSFCQIEGTYVPVADMNLAAGDGVYFAHHMLLWKDPQVNVTTMPLKGAWKRLFAGMPLIMTEAHGPGHIAFSKDNPGELVPIPLQPGQALDVREHLFLVATSNVAYDWFQTGVWFRTKNGDDTETHYPIGMFMDRFTSPQAPGLLLLHAGGNVFVRTLAEHESILIKPTALIFKDPAVQMHIHFERPQTSFRSWGYWSNRYLWLRLTGPGRVAIQSVFEHIEGEARNITGNSYATEHQW